MRLYFDSAYIAKCYLPEPGAEKVRAVARSASFLCSSSICIAELACIFQRQARECGVSPEVLAILRSHFREDLANDVWRLVPVTRRLLDRVDALVQALPPACPIRAGDAVHLATAIENGFQEIWSNDRRLLAAAQAVGLQPRWVNGP